MNHKDLTQAKAGEATMEQSRINRYGHQYYPVDPSYDKRVYENTVGNWFLIVGALIIFWIFQGIHWWGVFELGINDSTALMYYSIGIFVYTIIFGIGLLTSGKYANLKKRRHTFYKEKITLLDAEEAAKVKRAEQQEIYERKMREQAEQNAREAAEEAARA